MLSYSLASGLAVLSFGALSVSAYDASRTDNVGLLRVGFTETFAADSAFSHSLLCKPHVRRSPFVESDPGFTQLLGPELVWRHALRRHRELPEEPLLLLPGQTS